MDILDSRNPLLASVPHVTEFRDVFVGFHRYMTGAFPDRTLDHLDRLMDDMAGKPGLNILGQLVLQVFNHTRESTLEKFVGLVPDIAYAHLKTIFGVERSGVPMVHVRPLLAPLKKALEKLASSDVNVVPFFINTLGGVNPNRPVLPETVKHHQALMVFMVEEGFFTDEFLALVLPDLMDRGGANRQTGAGFLCEALVDRARRNLDALLETSPIPKPRPVRL
jgi:hypothetical protein